MCRELATEGVIAGYVAEAAPTPVQPDPLVAGWWTNRAAGIWFLRQAASPTLLMLSAAPEHGFDGGMLLEARLKGIRRILYVANDGSIDKEVDVVTELIRLLGTAAVVRPVHKISYDELFDEIYELMGDRLRLPSAVFIPGRILLLIGSLRGGGAERQAANTAAELSKRFPGQVFIGRCVSGGAADFYKSIVDAAGVQAHVVASAAPEYEAAEIAAICEQLAARYGGLGGLSIFHMIFHHALLIRELCPEIVHTWMDYSNTLGGLAADLVGAPRLVMSGRSLAPDNFRIFQPYMAPAYRAILARRDAIMLNNSQAGARDYARWLGLSPDRIRIIANGYPAPLLESNSRGAIRAALKIPDTSMVVGGMMEFREEKRSLLWLEMAALLHQADPQVRFVIYGNGPLLETCRIFVETNTLADIISLPGETSDVWGALSAMDIFVLTSRAEGLPNVMIEAQLAGLPVICTGIGGMYETFVEGETGFGVPEGTPEALMRAVGRLIDDPALRRQINRVAPRRALNAFGIERMINETIEAYRSAKDERAVFPPDWHDVPRDGIVRLGGIVCVGDSFATSLPADIDASELALWEDHTALRLIGISEAENLGGGQYRLCGSRVYFIPPDRSDPRFNGRVYCLRPRNLGFDEVHLDRKAIRAEIGNCYIVHLGPDPGSRHLGLWEDRARLGPGGCLHDEIRAQGAGRYSLWGETLYFSASDNSDPRSNGRSYLLRRERPTSGIDVERLPHNAVSLDIALRQMLTDVAPRFDFVPGRVVHVSSSLGPGGAERQIVYTLAGLRQRPIESAQLLCYHLSASPSARHDFYVPPLRAAGVPSRDIRRYLSVANLDLLPRSLRALRHALPGDLVTDIGDLYWEFMDLRPEVVHAWLDGNLERAGIAAALAGVPRIVLGARNLNPTHFAYARPHMLPAYRALIGLPQLTMINNSLAGRDDFADWLGVERDTIGVIYNGIEFPEYRRPNDTARTLLRAKFALDNSHFVVGGIFRFAEEKRPRLWIDTASEVARRLPAARFILFGGGELQDEMERLAERSGLRGRLIFAGIATEILDMIGMMDVLLLTSAFEGIPNVVLEAQWAGTPVVATRAGGTPEAVEEGLTGWIVDKPSAAALAERLIWLHRNSAVAQGARLRGPTFVRKKFGVRRMVDETVALYGLRHMRGIEAADPE